MLTINKKIELRQTQNIGKGFFAKQVIQIGQQLLNIPDDRFISCDRFCQIYEFQDIKCLSEISTKTLFAYFLSAVYVVSPQHNKQYHADIYEYFKILPKQIHGLVNWSKQQLNLLQNKELVQNIKRKQKMIEIQYLIIQQKIRIAWKEPKHIWEYRIFSKKQQIQLITVQLVRYFYSVIQSRAVHYQCQSDEKSNVGALAPYLQLFNHSPDPQCQVNGNQRFVVKNIRKIEKDEQIFVSYGNYDTQKFLEIYGFIPTLEHPISEKNNYRQKITIIYNKLFEKKKSQMKINNQE